MLLMRLLRSSMVLSPPLGVFFGINGVVIVDEAETSCTIDGMDAVGYIVYGDPIIVTVIIVIMVDDIDAAVVAFVINGVGDDFFIGSGGLIGDLFDNGFLNLW
ncbi:hypothetical protein NDU88_006087 [Pleurodeles waltl]|uniref:Uncharacterized protein n=1 Tax=Pleurodeles waltl TaxID=8319 RepID=A0AAV7SNI1_PLEWA|nr:hypothetical protein NDU88_006087 [Pleurodeles waltl]